MIGLEVTVRCPFHDAPVEIVTVGDPEGDMSASTVRCTVCRSVFTVSAVMTAHTVRFGWPELQRYVEKVVGLPRHENGCACINTGAACCSGPASIAQLVGVKTDTVQSWARRGLAEWKADQAATALGVHPSVIWPDAWAVLTELDLLDDELEAVS